VTHPPGCDCPKYGCQLRRKGLSFSADATPTARARRPFRKAEQPSWEKGISGEHRVDGSFMPYLTETGRKIRVKEAGERRHELTDIRRRQVAGPAPQE
jgi:hypothetical protein